MSHDLDRTNTLHISLHYGIYNSSHPATFLRQAGNVAGQPDAMRSPLTTPPVTPPEVGSGCEDGAKRSMPRPFHLVLDGKVAAGATALLLTGTAHPCIQSGDIAPTQARLVFKVAVGDDQCQRLIGEADVYERLQSARVRGIPRFYGLFRDSEDGTLGLLLSLAPGMSLHAWQKKEYSVSVHMRYACLPSPFQRWIIC